MEFYFNFWYLLLSSLAYLIIGSIWYGILNNAWLKEIGSKKKLKIQEKPLEQLGTHALPFLGAWLLAISVVSGFRILEKISLNLTNSDLFFQILKLCGFGFILPSILIIYKLQKRSFRLIIIDGGFLLAYISACLFIYIKLFI